MKTSAETSDFERFYETDLEFHRTIWKLSRNRYLASTLETLVVPLFSYFLIRTRKDYRSICSPARNATINCLTPSAPALGQRGHAASLETSASFGNRLDARLTIGPADQSRSNGPDFPLTPS